MSCEFFDGTDGAEINTEEQKKEEQRKKTFNGLCASEWAELSKSVWNDVSSTRKKKHLNHGATFPEKLCKRLNRINVLKAVAVSNFRDDDIGFQ